MTRLPPTRVVRAATALRTALQSLTRRMAPPEVCLLEFASGFVTTHAVYAAARLGIADVLADGPLTADDVAAEVGSDPDATHRLLRACATFGIFREDPRGLFRLTPVAERLRSDTSDSMLPVVLMLGDPAYQRPWGRLAHCVETGRPAVEEMFGMPMWEYLDEHPEFAATFNDAMTRLSALDWPTVEAAYDFTPYSTIVDIGGGHGQLLARILGAAPLAKGVLQEREALAGDAEEHLRAAGVLPRCRIEAGSFFETAPSDGDLYVLRRVVHDFDDGQATAILTNVRRHMPRGATLLLMESVVPPGNTPHFAKTLDLDMMLFVGGRERTEREFATLLERAGFRMTRVVPTISTISLVEAVSTGGQL
ncbi:acetylserotonin O-methyltransferase [Rhodococcus sp. F64268]|uniref:acetylserotonin O-methyltransferase n=1 Tax=Rhodococcus sp. F64268 TaxID=2926402 RepID=UPI001FF1D855|nr:acetylserotonin O-methyltransferase [Rhodococcus sp. F64268]MCK0090528.1 acetylserotonin O-methyltransferase [Rhodococcus sp. F64268]